jgi:hypothetical protein
VKVTQPAGKQSAAGISRRSAAAVVARLLLWVLAFTLLAAIIIVLLQPRFLQQASIRLEQRWGYVFKNYDRALTDKWSIAIGSYMREAVDGIPEIPELIIDVPFKEMTKIYAKRDAALERGILVQGSDDFVKGEIRFEDRTIPIKLRLKGDWNDHLMGRKWSFRIRVRGDDELFGMRRFSIQHPNTRGFQSELLYFEMLRDLGVMVPRYMFVNVTLNGESMGLMALEEFFAKEMLEYNERRDGVIVRFDESLVWNARDSIYGEDVGWGGAFDHYASTRVDAIGSSRIAESPALARQYALAAGLLNGFVAGTLPASEVFNVQQLAAYLAVSDMFGAWHAVAWHNMRFYLNPITLRLEPMPFDATLQDRFEDDVSIISSEPLLVQMLRDPLLWQAYTHVLQSIAPNLDAVITRLRAVEQTHLPVLQTEFRMVGEFPLDYLQSRNEALLARAIDGPGADDTDLALDLEHERDEYPVLAHLGVLASAGQSTLRIDNAIPRDVEIIAVEWASPGGAESVSAVHKEIFPLAVPARGIWSAPWRFDLDLAPPPEPDWSLQVTARMTGRAWSVTQTPVAIYEALTQVPIAAGDLATLQAANPFLLHPADSNLLVIRAGTHTVTAPLVLPRGMRLRIEAGATLEFAEDAPLIVNGPIEFVGTADSPVVLQPLQGATWPGLAVMEAGQEGSAMRHTVVRDTHGVALGGWALTGGVNFYFSSVKIENSQFIGSHGEDALNVIHSGFEILDTVISETASDAFDADFSTGSVVNSRFLNIGIAGGGDAVDVSGSEIVVRDTVFTDVSDKALSVGERSQMSAANVTIENVGTGAAAKDGSRLNIEESTIRGAAFAGLTAYIKKPEYGPAEIEALNVTIAEAEPPTLVQTGSRITIDGSDVAAQDVDVDALYETVMRKGLR